MLPSYFDYIFGTKTKSTSQARIKPEIFVNFRPKPDPKSPARLTTLSQIIGGIQSNYWGDVSPIPQGFGTPAPKARGFFRKKFVVMPL